MNKIYQQDIMNKIYHRDDTAGKNSKKPSNKSHKPGLHLNKNKSKDAANHKIGGNKHFWKQVNF